MPQFVYHKLCKTGRRKTNQDSVGLFVNKKKNAYLLIVADGMGGYKGGEIASKIVIDTAKEVFNKSQGVLKLKNELKSIIRLIFDLSQNRIKEAKQANPELSGMGTTMACVLVVDNYAVWANIGDSRIYLKTKEDLRLVTKDHSLIQDFMDNHNGSVTYEYAKQFGNIITKSLSGNDDAIDIFPMDSDYYKFDDSFLFMVCSDGLIVDKSYDYSLFFQETFNNFQSLTEAVNYLYDWAYNSGSTDNISIVALKKDITKINNFLNKKSKLIILAILILSVIIPLIYFQTNENKKTENNNNLIAIWKPKPKHKPKTETSNIEWKGFYKSNSTLIYPRDKSNELNWYEFKGDNFKGYRIKVFNDNNEVNSVKVNKQHIPVKKLINDEILKSNKTYTIKIYAISGNKLIESPNDVKMQINKK